MNYNEINLVLQRDNYSLVVNTILFFFKSLDNNKNTKFKKNTQLAQILRIVDYTNPWIEKNKIDQG